MHISQPSHELIQPGTAWQHKLMALHVLFTLLALAWMILLKAPWQCRTSKVQF